MLDNLVCGIIKMPVFCLPWNVVSAYVKPESIVVLVVCTLEGSFFYF